MYFCIERVGREDGDSFSDIIFADIRDFDEYTHRLQDACARGCCQFAAP